MKQFVTSARKIGHQLTALTLLALSLLLPVAPMLQASPRPMPEDCASCRRAAKKCDRKSHAKSMSEPAWTAAQGCAKECARPDSVPSSIGTFVAAARLTAPSPRSAPDKTAAARPDRTTSAYSAWLYQRPPPRS